MKQYNFSDLIWCNKNALSKKVCNHVISKFENDDNKYTGRILSGIDTSFKRSTDLSLSSLSQWKEEDKIFSESLYENVKTYFSLYKEEFNFFQCIGNISDSGYQIQRTRPGEFYKWHHDFLCHNNKYRILTLIWYLNDVEYDGETQFIDGTKIKPETGKLMIFPATWNYVHCGVPPKSETKYLCTTWVSIQTFEKDGKVYHS